MRCLALLQCLCRLPRQDETAPKPMATIQQLADSVDRLVLRHQELKRASVLL